MTSISDLREQFLQHLEQSVVQREPAGLYAPVHYILQLGGKRLRPLLTLMSAQMYGVTIKDALPAATAVEIFHNFTLLHDDIMDAAPLRRGQQTVHEKWDVNTGILSGDAMLILAYQQFNGYAPQTFYELHQLFSRTALEVCEGQQYDVEFETRDDVSIPEYLNMIKLKTSVLVGCALQMGAIVAGKDTAEQEKIYNYGIQLGMAFQLMDDYLDTYGDPATFGKEVGGDIRENKKTYLYLTAIENPQAAAALKALFAIDHTTQSEDQIAEKKETAARLFKSSGAANKTLGAIEDYTQQALQTIHTLNVSNANKDALTQFSRELMSRIS